MKNIIVPVDFSPVSVNAALYAAHLAEYYGADLTLYHSFQLPLPIAENNYPFVSSSEMMSAADFELKALMDDLQKKLKRNIFMFTVAEETELESGLERICAEKKADLVVMGTTGKDALTRLVMGSNTLKAIHRLNYPVLVVPKDGQFNAPKKIGFACDYRKVLESTPIDLLKKILTEFAGELHVLNIDWQNRNFKPETPEESIFLSEILKDFRPTYHQLENEDITLAVNAFADENKLDLIVMIPKKHNLLEKLFRRSFTKNMLYHTHIPILCLHE